MAMIPFLLFLGCKYLVVEIKAKGPWQCWCEPENISFTIKKIYILPEMLPRKYHIVRLNWLGVKAHNSYNDLCVIQYFTLFSLLMLPIKWKWEGKAQFIWDYLRIWCSSSVCKVFAYLPTLLPRECSQNLNRHFPPLQKHVSNIVTKFWGRKHEHITFLEPKFSHCTQRHLSIAEQSGNRYRHYQFKVQSSILHTYLEPGINIGLPWSKHTLGNWH